jgi:hypothetical protein
MPAIFKKFFEDHGTAAVRTIHRALTIHMSLLIEAPGYMPGLPGMEISF